MLSDDNLPQPFRFINKIVQNCLGDAWEIINKKQKKEDQGKVFAPSRALPLQRSPGNALSVLSEKYTCSAVSSTETVCGCSDGVVKVFNNPAECELHCTTPLFEANQPVTCVSLTTMTPIPLYAAATSNAIQLFYYVLAPVKKSDTSDRVGSVTPRFPGGDETKPQSEKSGDEDAPLYNFVSLCTIKAEKLMGGKLVAAIELSKDASFLAVTTQGGNEVLVFSLPVLPPGQTVQAPTGSPQVPTEATLLTKCSPPFIYLTEGHPCVAMPAFLTLQPPPNLGYYKESQQLRPYAHTLCIAWGGQNILSVYSLRHYASSDSVNALLMETKEHMKKIQADQQAMLQSPTAGQALGGGGGGGKAGKGDKGKGGGAVASNANVADGSIHLPPSEGLFDGVQHKLLSQCASSIAVNSAGDLCAVGCFDGIIEVFSPSLGYIKHRFVESQHRAEEETVNKMAVTALRFHKAGYLVAACSVPKAMNRSSISVFSLATNTKVASVPFLSRISCLSLVDDLPCFFFVANDRGFLADLKTAALIAEIPDVPASLAYKKDQAPEDEAIMPNFLSPLQPSSRSQTPGLRSNTPNMPQKDAGKNQPGGLSVSTKEPKESKEPTPGSSLQNVNAMDYMLGRLCLPQQHHTASLEDSIFVLAPPQSSSATMSSSVWHISTSSALFDAYPHLSRAFNQCSLEQLDALLMQLPPEGRNDQAAIGAVPLPGTLESFTKKSVYTGMMGEHSVTSGRQTAGRAVSLVASSQGLKTGHSTSNVEKGVATFQEQVKGLVEIRDMGRAGRAARFKSQWDGLKNLL